MQTSNNKPKFDYLSLDQNGKTIVEYVWIGGTGYDIRSKAKTYDGKINSIKDLDEWNYDGSSTFQATTESSEVLIRPVALFNDPFRKGDNKIALCTTYHVDGKPTNTNFRHFAEKIFSQGTEEHEPWFGIEQEYVMLKAHGTSLAYPLGWPLGGFPTAQGPFYCSVGAKFCHGREVMDAHYRACLYAGVKIFGTNSEVMPGQWEFQIGTCNGIEIADHLWMARYLLYKVGEFFEVDVSFHPKPVLGDWNGSGAHTNYSTNGTRNDTDMKVINDHMDRLERTHTRLIGMYGENNHLRLTGKHETSSIENFIKGVANRAASIRIPRTTEKSGKGYYEDRRPSANMDPYVICSSIYSVTCLNNYGLDDLELHYVKFLEHKKGVLYQC